MKGAADGSAKPSEAFLCSLHPSGDPATVIVVDGLAIEGHVDQQSDVVVLTMTPQRARDRAQCRTMTFRALAALAPGGILWVGAPGSSRRTIMALLRAKGLKIGAVTVHRRRGLAFNEFTLSEEGLSDAVGSGHVSRRWDLLPIFMKRVRGARAMLLRVLPDVGFIAFQPSAVPFGWLTDRLPEKQKIAVSVATSWRGPAAPYLVFASSGRFSLIAKRGGRQCHSSLAHEAEALSQLSDGAARAGLQVPRIVEYRTGRRICSLIETAVPGRPMAGWIRDGRHGNLGVIADRLADWLGRWNSETRRTTTLTPALIQSLIISPIHELAEVIDGSYRGSVVQKAEQLMGREVPVVAAHNDLTMSNVLANREAIVSVVDWEAASPEGLPLTDFHYAVCDAETLINGGDRIAAFRACFLDDTKTRSRLYEREDRLRALIGGPAEWLELCFHAGWLRHAANERARLSSGSHGDFMAIASLLKEKLGQ